MSVVYSVKAYDSAVGAFVHQFMTRDRKAAFARKRDIDNHDRHVFRPARVVRPALQLITAFVALGNTID
jgi:hypothetical protein